MTKSQLISRLWRKKAHLTKRASEEAIETFFEEVIRSLKKGDKVVVSGFGTFYLGKSKIKKLFLSAMKPNVRRSKVTKLSTFASVNPSSMFVW